jgi:hypothetical protein
MHIDNAYEVGEEVYYILGGEDSKGIVTAILTRGADNIEYEVSWQGKYKSWHTDIELTTSNTSVL